MSKIVRFSLVVVGLILGGLLLALLGANLYLQSEGVQSRIRQAASDSLGAEVKTGGGSFSPWGGLVIRTLSVSNPDRPEQNLLSADFLRLRFAVFPLLRGRLVIRKVVLGSPVFTVQQNQRGDLMAVVPPAPRQEIPVTVPGRTPDAQEKTFKVTIERVQIEKGSIVFVDAGGRKILRSENVSIEAVVHDDRTSEGAFSIREMEIFGALKPRRMKGVFTWDGRVLKASLRSGVLAEGAMEGLFQLTTGDPASFILSLSLQQARLQKLAEDAGVRSEGMSGTLEGHIGLAGDPLHGNKLTGNATVTTRSAEFVPVDFLVQFGQMFGVDELQRLNLSEGLAELRIADERVLIEILRLQSENLILTGTGRVGFDGRLDVDAALLVNKKLQSRLRSLMGRNFRAAEDPNYKQLDFKVFGAVSRPKTDLLEKLTGIKIDGNLGGLLQQFFRKPTRRTGDDAEP